MDTTIKNENELKEKLGIKTWRELSKDKVLEYIQLSPNIDKELHIKILENVPNFVQATNEVLKGIRSVAEENNKTTGEIIQSLNLIINSLDSLSKKDNLSESERNLYTDKMIQIAQILSQIDNRNKEFLKEVLKYFAAAGGFALAILAVIFGVKFLNPESNKS